MYSFAWLGQKAPSTKGYIMTRDSDMRSEYTANLSESTERHTVGSVIGCKQFRVAVMLFAGGAWGVVGCLFFRIARHTGPDGIYRAEEAGGVARAQAPPEEAPVGPL